MAHEKHASCIEACVKCGEECEHCADACLSEQDVKAMAQCIRLDRDCAEICWAAAAWMSRGSKFAVELCRLCAEVCSACGAECRQHQADHCQRCADACELVEEGVDVSVLEARERIGGRIHTIYGGWPTPLEAGPEFLHGKNAEFDELVRLLRHCKAARGQPT